MMWEKIRIPGLAATWPCAVIIDREGTVRLIKTKGSTQKVWLTQELNCKTESFSKTECLAAGSWSDENKTLRVEVKSMRKKAPGV